MAPKRGSVAQHRKKSYHSQDGMAQQAAQETGRCREEDAHEDWCEEKGPDGVKEQESDTVVLGAREVVVVLVVASY